VLLTWELSSKTGFNDVSKVAVLVDPGRNARKEQVSEMSPPKIQGKEVLHRFKRFITIFCRTCSMYTSTVSAIAFPSFFTRVLK